MSGSASPSASGRRPGFLFANAAGYLRVLRPPTLTNVAPYAFGVNEMLRLDRRRRPGGPLVSSS